ANRGRWLHQIIEPAVERSHQRQAHRQPTEGAARDEKGLDVGLATGKEDTGPREEREINDKDENVERVECAGSRSNSLYRSAGSCFASRARRRFRRAVPG